MLFRHAHALNDWTQLQKISDKEELLRLKFHSP
jgi:hypothetical protein